jgi:CheY-like chemotaxis protein
MPDRIPLLLVEDNLADLRLVTELLEDEARGRFRIEPARRLSEALEALRDCAFAAVILDLSLPDATGVAAIEAIREAAPGTPIIVLSGLLDDETRRTAAGHGAAASFVKGDTSIAPLVAEIDRLAGQEG